MFIGIIILIILVLVITFLIVRNYYISFVKERSVLISKINELNQKYTFYPFVNYDQSYTYDNKDYFETITEEDYLIYQLQFMSCKLEEQIRLMTLNKVHFREYISCIKAVELKGQYNQSTVGLIPKLLNYYENKLYRQIVKSPDTDYHITITLFHSSLNGYIHDRKFRTFNSNEIQELIIRLRNKSGTFYRDRGIWDSLCRVERGKVSNKIRFAVYERDGYRCRHCHRTQKVVSLEIDHIIPISKGGKSTLDNLQTLCHDCNAEKGNRFK